MIHKYEDIVSVEDILEAWQEFLKGKRNKPDVQNFSFHLMDNIFDLHEDLINHTYKHGPYQQFEANDPKPRTIHKASVRDRLLHHSIYRKLYPFFDKKFVVDSFSCRNNKGTHKAISQFRKYCLIVSKNNTKTCWVLKCDIKKFFASVDQQTLIKILDQHIVTFWPRRQKVIVDLLGEIISSFNSGKLGVGLPLGNLTSQLFANVYMNEFDQFVKHKLKAKYYIRYADDFVVLSEDRKYLEALLPLMKEFLKEKLLLFVHPDKISIETLYRGVDYLGWVNFKHNRVLRTKTKRRMFERLSRNNCKESLNSYLGLLKHGDTYNLRKKVVSLFKID